MTSDELEDLTRRPGPGLHRTTLVLDRGQVVHRSASEELLKHPETLDRLVAVA